jgi:hypothetical protein
VNGNKIKVFNPLDINISTRVRKDEKVEISDASYFKAESLIISMNFENVFDDSGKNSSKSDRPVHYFCVVIAKRFSPVELLRQVTTLCRVSEEESKARILNFFKKEEQLTGLAVPRERLTVICPVSCGDIQFPGRVDHFHLGKVLCPSTAILSEVHASSHGA